MDFHNFRTVRDACKRSGAFDDRDDFYRTAIADAIKMGSGQFYGQLINERDWERARRPDAYGERSALANLIPALGLIASVLTSLMFFGIGVAVVSAIL